MEPITIKILETTAKTIYSFLLKGTFSEIKRTIKEYNGSKLITKQDEFEKAVIKELQETYTWASRDLFKNHNNNDGIYERYVHLDLYLTPRRLHSSRNEVADKKPIKEVLISKKNNLAILGQPGSGKTTSMKYIFNSILLDPEFLDGVYFYPMIIRLRTLNESNSYLGNHQSGGIFELLCDKFNLNFNFDAIPKEEREKTKKMFVRDVVPNILDSLKILLILDGFDEIGSDKIRNLVIEEIQELSKSLNYVNYIITSRSADFPYQIENLEKLEISEIDDDQLKTFANNWFENELIATQFLHELIKKTPYKDFYRRPLLLTHLASIYSKSKEIPDKPKLIYQTIINLILKEWNEMQNVKRSSKYSSFSIDRKREFLSCLAFHLKLKYNKAFFSREELFNVYQLIHKRFSLPNDEVDVVLDEIESHNGILIKSGYNSFEFSHLTIQEYLTADYIVRGGTIRLTIDELLLIPNELAISISLSSEPSLMLYEILIEKILTKTFNTDFVIKFFNRINLENPDFSNEPILGVSLLYAFTKHIDIERDSKADSATKSQNLNSKLKFQDFIYKNNLNAKIEMVLEYYSIDNEKLNTEFDNYIGLRKKKHITDEILRFKLPKYLICKKEFISSN
jgi:hypothetical protein